MASSSKDSHDVGTLPWANPQAEPTGPSNPSIPDALQSLLDWNPPLLRAQTHDKGGTIGDRTGVLCFYNKHLTPDLVLKHLQYHPDLAAQIASTVDTAIEAALADGGKLPPPGGRLMERLDRRDFVAGISSVMSRELPVTSFYDKATAFQCTPVASTLALHPKAHRWLSLLHWSMAPNAAGYAITDGSLQIFDIDEEENEAIRGVVAEIRASMDPDMFDTVRKLAATYPDIAIWEMKSLVVGDENVMVGLKGSASSGRPFNWIKCTCDGKTHKADFMAVENTRAGPDAPTTPWTLPEVYEELTQSVYITDVDDTGEEDDEEAGASTTRESPPVTADPGPSIVSDTEEEATPKGKGKGRADVRRKSSRSPTKRKRDGHYRSNAMITADDIVQQAWAQAVRTDSTIIVLHSGNYEFVCVRHRESQTLYVSDIIHPSSCKAPAYGKLHVGIYIAAIQDAILRMKFGGTLHPDKRSKLPSNFSKFNKRDKDKDGGGDGKDGPANGDGGERSSRGGSKRRKKDGAPPSGGKGKRTGSGKGRGASKPRRRTRGNLKHEREEQDKTIMEANRRDIVLVSLRYGIYNSPNPAAFFRKAPAILQPGQTPTPPPTPKLRKVYTPGTYSTIVINSEIGQGSTGKVHGGTFILNSSDDDYMKLNVAVKLSFDEDAQERLLHEYFMYRYLNSKGVKGIPTALGLFVDPESGPSALVLTHGGRSLFHIPNSEVQYFQREAFQTTLKAIHTAGVLHGDIRSPNLLIDESGESFIIDFDQAEKNNSENAQEAEYKELCRILEGKDE